MLTRAADEGRAEPRGHGRDPGRAVAVLQAVRGASRRRAAAAPRGAARRGCGWCRGRGPSRSSRSRGWPGPPADDAACTDPGAGRLPAVLPARDGRRHRGVPRHHARGHAGPARRGARHRRGPHGAGRRGRRRRPARRPGRDVVRLLPPSDPYLQGRDRELLVPDPAHRKQIWTSLGAPGVVVSGVDVVGVWRPTQKARRLDVAVTPFRPLAPRSRRRSRSKRSGWASCVVRPRSAWSDPYTGATPLTRSRTVPTARPGEPGCSRAPGPPRRTTPPLARSTS